jgi:hypothetical protein
MNQGPAYRDPLLFATRELVREPLAPVIERVWGLAELPALVRSRQVWALKESE